MRQPPHIRWSGWLLIPLGILCLPYISFLFFGVALSFALSAECLGIGLIPNEAVSKGACPGSLISELVTLILYYGFLGVYFVTLFVRAAMTKKATISSSKFQGGDIYKDPA
jgi:hypothetical protein